MKLWISLSALLLTIGCSHASTTASGTKATTPAETTSKTAPKAAKAPTAAKGKAKAEAKSGAKTEAVATDKASCKSADDIRNLEIVTKGDGCAVNYTKHKETKEIASAEHETDHCKQVLTKVRGHLEASGFTCE